MPVRPISRAALPVALCLAALLALAGCDAPETLELADLTPEETRFVTRFVQLERARAVALADRDAGLALLDSLGVAWGDTSLAEARAGIPEDSKRQARLFHLLERLLLAERDSLLEAPRPDRVGAPLPEPYVEPPAEEPDLEREDG